MVSLCHWAGRQWSMSLKRKSNPVEFTVKGKEYLPKSLAIIQGIIFIP